jgi:hypothetical protein
MVRCSIHRLVRSLCGARHQGGYDNIAVAMAGEKSSSFAKSCHRLARFAKVNKVHRGPASGKLVKTEISVELGVQLQIP